MKKKLILFVALVLIIMPLSAIEFRGGVIVNAGRGYISENSRNMISGISDYRDVSYINLMGPQVEIAFNPLSNDKYTLGLRALGSYELVPGINGAIPESVKKNLDININDFRIKDYRISAELGLTFSYNFMNTTGVFLDAGFNYDWYRIATTNDPNNKKPVTYVKFNEYGIKGTLGIITRNRNSYYKFGFSYSKNLSNNFKGFSLGLLVAGGFVF